MNHQTKFKQTEIEMIPEDWKQYELHELCNFKTGKLNSNAAVKNGKFPFFTCSPKILSIDKFSYNQEAILLSGNNAEGIFNVKYYKGKFDAYQRTYIIEIKNNNILDYKFLYYLLIIFLNYLRELSIGTATKFLTLKILNKIEIKIPPLEEQKQIATSLSSLDNKIELNSQINKNLEKIAQAIFKHWFVDFEFPNENGKPYKSIGGEMVNSETDLIPKGWRFEKLGNLLSEIVTGNRPKGGVSEFKQGIPSIGAESINGLCNFNFSKTKYIPELYFSDMKKGIVKNGDILLYKDGANLGRKSMYLENFPFKKCCVNSHVFILRSNSSMKQSYLFFYLDQEYMTKNIINLNTNSAQPGINSTSVKTLKILLPSDKMLNLFDELVFPILKTIFNNAKENKCLSNLRNALLPKLMSGEIRVPINIKEGNE